MRAVMRKVIREDKGSSLPMGSSVVKSESNNVGENNPNAKLVLNECSNLTIKKEPVSVNSTYNNNNVNSALAKAADSFSSIGSSGGAGSPSLNINSTMLSSASNADLKNSYPFLGDGKVAKVRKRKSALDFGSGTRSPNNKISEDVTAMMIEANDNKSVDSFDALRKDTNKLASIKRRSSADSLSDSTGCDLAALREQVYGAGSAANFAKFNFMPSKDMTMTKNDNQKDSLKKQLKKQKSETGIDPNRKSPIVLDLTENSNKKVTTSTHSVNLSAALLKRPGIEIIPISGSNTPISIPSSITVTPVVKSSDDRLKDKKDKQRIRETKDKKRKREDSPTNLVTSMNKSSKVQIITTGSNMKHSTSMTSIGSSKLESSKTTTTKSNNSTFQSPVKKSSLSPNFSSSKTAMQNKISFSPSHKSSKVVYSPNSKTASPKQQQTRQESLSPKHSSLGKPSMNTLKSNSPTFTNKSISPKMNKGSKDKVSTPSTSPLTNSSSSISKSQKLSPSSEKIKPALPDALTITKVPVGEVSPSSSSSNSSNSSNSMTSMDKLSLERAKASPPKNRKGSSLSDIVDKLRAGAGASGLPESKDAKSKDKKGLTAAESSQSRESNNNNFTIKPSTGLKFTINKSKNAGTGTTKSGLKPGVLSGPASKKLSSMLPIPKLSSTSNLPPIPKLPPSSISAVTTSTVSPLGTSISSHTSPLSYVRVSPVTATERNLTKERITKTKDGSITKSQNHQEMNTKREMSKSKDSISPLKKQPSQPDALDKALKDMFGVDDSPPPGGTTTTTSAPSSSKSGSEPKEANSSGKQIGMLQNAVRQTPIAVRVFAFTNT